MKDIFEKIRNFSVLDERDCQAACGLSHIGANLVAKGVLGKMGQIHPISTCIEGKLANLEIWGFHQTQAGLGVDGPHNTTWHLQNTPGAAAIHFPLGAAGSQSALYTQHTHARTHACTHARMHV